ncbi:hypothetical protein L218DRAFT_951216 [Marasmius fiardii PR-910]|nr:hypothetical protein L218DRAFT_951216 [Marasmius fiardii PR-910]
MSLDRIAEAYKASVTIWIPMQATSLAGLILIQLTTLFGGLVRGRVWYGFMVSMTMFSLSSCLLYISGQQPSNKQQEPGYRICLAQATLVYSVEPLAIAMLMSLFFERRASSPWLLVLPYGFWCFLMIAYLDFGLLDPRKPNLQLYHFRDTCAGNNDSGCITIIFAVQDHVPLIYHVIAQAGGQIASSHSDGNLPLVVTIVFGTQKFRLGYSIQTLGTNLTAMITMQKYRVQLLIHLKWKRQDVWGFYNGYMSYGWFNSKTRGRVMEEVTPPRINTFHKESKSRGNYRSLNQFE